jgi:chromate reductase, NAD(P)H dehydrogenase (quinone)
MAYVPKILCFAGSLRRDSFNKKLVKLAMASAKDSGADVTYLDFKELPLPLFDEDLEREQGLPDNAKTLHKIMREHQGFLLSCPEYNSSVTGVLKNAIDWASRPLPGEDGMALACFRGKVAALMAASPGALGGLRGLVTVRSILGNIGVLVIPDQVAVPKAHEAFNNDGSLRDPKQHDHIKALSARLVDIARRLFETK